MNVALSMQEEKKETEILLKNQLTEIGKKIEAAEEKFITGDIDKEIYDKYRVKFKAEKSKILDEIDSLSINLSNLQKSINKYCNLLMNIPSLWASGGYDEKIEIQNLLFPDGILYFRNLDDYRTTKINSPILHLLAMAGDLGNKKSGTSNIFVENSALVARTGIEPVSDFPLVSRYI